MKKRAPAGGEDRRLVSEVDLDYGWEYFESHDSGIHLSQDGINVLLGAIAELTSEPARTVLLEGHCPGDIDENDDIRESVGEEAADLCKARLLQAGVKNQIVCKGLGSSQGLGMRVVVSLVEPQHRKSDGKEDEPPSPAAPAQPGDAAAQEERRQSDQMWTNLLGDARQAEAAKQEDVPAEEVDFELRDMTGMHSPQRLALLEEQLMKVMPDGISFDANKAQVAERHLPLLQKLAAVLKAFPELGLQCAGHAKGKPGDNNLAKRVLSQDRARALAEAISAEGATNSVACVGFGSALGRGNCVRLHGLLPGEAEEEDAELKILGWNTGSLSAEQEKASIDQLLKEALSAGMSFEPNRASIHPNAALVVRRISWVLKAFPTWTISCDGHAKGQPADDNEAKRQLSQVRAEALRASLQALGVTNKIVCHGHGCSKGLGMGVRMHAVEPDRDVEVPDLEGLTQEQRFEVLDGLLARILDRGVDFEANKHDVPASALGVVRSLAKVLRAFPDAVVRLEGHAKGKPQDNNEAKRKLSQARAEAVRAAVRLEGAQNGMLCAGEGSARGHGAGLMMFVADPEELRSREIEIPDAGGMSREEQEKLVNSLLAKALEANIEFEPNSHAVPMSGMDTVRTVARVLEAFPSFAIQCEGHAKGQPAENNAAKTKLSHLRAEALKAAVLAEGVTNVIRCVGRGCEQGLGMCVRMIVEDPGAAGEGGTKIPDRAGLSREEQESLLNQLLAEALKKKISFEPNSTEIEVTVRDTIAELARILKAFPDFPVTCEGHTKGQSADNNLAKMRLSQARAESVRAALEKEGVQNEFACVGQGCSQGLGMCVRMFTASASASAAPPAPSAAAP